MLGVRGVAVFGDDRASIVAIGVGGLMCRGISSRVRVIRLPCSLRAVRGRDSRAARIRSSIWIVSSPNSRSPIRTVRGRGGTIESAMPCAVSIVNVASVYDGAAVPIAVPVAVTPTTTTIVNRSSHGDANSKCKNGGRRHICATVPWRRNRGTVDNCGVVLRDVHYLRIGRLNHDRLRRLLYNRDL